MSKKKETEDLGRLPNSAHMFRESDGAGGFSYWSNEVDGGINVWTTSLVDESTLTSAIHYEHIRKFNQFISESKQKYEPTSESQMEQCAATGGAFLPTKILESLGQVKDHDDSPRGDSMADVSDRLKTIAMKCYLAYCDNNSNHKSHQMMISEFDAHDDIWKNSWISVASVVS